VQQCVLRLAPGEIYFPVWEEGGALLSTALVTGGTGTPGREVVSRLLKRHHRVRILSHHAQPVMSAAIEAATGDLASGTGLRKATRGAEVIMHCASNWRGTHMRTDVAGTRALLDAAWVGGLPHIIYPSIVDVDRTEYPYYRAKRDVEQMVEHSGFPWTVLRATQFYPMSGICCSPAACTYRTIGQRFALSNLPTRCIR
jgi:uncharacterized protein YbjT (DUF2867 family)